MQYIYTPYLFKKNTPEKEGWFKIEYYHVHVGLVKYFGRENECVYLPWIYTLLSIRVEWGMKPQIIFKDIEKFS